MSEENDPDLKEGRKVSFTLDPADPDPVGTIQCALNALKEVTDNGLPSVKVTHHINEHVINLPQRASLKELYLALADQVEPFDPNGACTLRTQANCTDNW